MNSSVLLRPFDQGHSHIPWTIHWSNPYFQTTVLWPRKYQIFSRSTLTLQCKFEIEFLLSLLSYLEILEKGQNLVKRALNSMYRLFRAGRSYRVGMGRPRITCGSLKMCSINSCFSKQCGIYFTLIYISQ